MTPHGLPCCLQQRKGRKATLQTQALPIPVTSIRTPAPKRQSARPRLEFCAANHINAGGPACMPHRV